MASAREDSPSMVGRRRFLGGALATSGVVAASALGANSATAAPAPAPGPDAHIPAVPGQVHKPQRYKAVPNGQTWFDTDGNAISAQGGGFLKVDSTYYWVGQDTAPSLTNSTAKVNLYRSTDLLNWTKVGAIITVDTPDAKGNKLLTYCKTERPKLLYNKKTRKYVLWLHWEENADYSASEVVVATASKVEGPYTVTAQGHRRPGFGNTGDSAMGDRVGALVLDFDTSPKDADNTAHAYLPVQPDYPFRIHQYNDVSTSNPDTLSYLGSSDYGAAQRGNWWTYDLSGVRYDMTLKVVAARMTAYDRTAYDKYSPDFNVSANSYIVRHPTGDPSAVTTHTFTIGDPGSQRTELVAPVIHPTLDESTSKDAVLVNANDAAFITIDTTGATSYFTTDGSDPADASNTARQQYWDGTRIVLTGKAGAVTTVRAVATAGDRTGPGTTTTYRIAADSSQVPIFQPVINFPTGTYESTAGAFGYMAMRVYSPTYGTEAYYTTDGNDPVPPEKGDNIGYRSRDMTVWQDPKDGNAYLVTASDDVFMRVWQLTDDYTDVVADKEYDIYVGKHREAPALVRHGGKNGKNVYLVTSSQSGYYPNQSQFARTADLTAGFSRPRDSTGYRDGESIWSDLQPFGDCTTYFSQPTYILNIGTDTKPAYLYIGDRNNTIVLFKSSYVWLPLTIDDKGSGGKGLAKIDYTPEPAIDLKHGRITPPKWELLSRGKPVTATPSVQLTADQRQAGTYRFDAGAANDGINYDVDSYDTVEQYYYPVSVPFYWQVDLGAGCELSWIGLSFISVSGSDSVNRYTVTGSNDGKTWTELFDNT
jgi:hypothetical protein